MGFMRRTFSKWTGVYITFFVGVVYALLSVKGAATGLPFMKPVQLADFHWIAYAFILGLFYAPWRHSHNSTLTAGETGRIVLMAGGAGCAVFAFVWPDPAAINDQMGELLNLFTLGAWVLLGLLIVSRIFSFRIRPGNYIIYERGGNTLGVVVKSKKAFWLKPGVKIEELPEFIEVAGVGVYGAFVKFTVSGRRTYADCLRDGQIVDVADDRETFLKHLLISMEAIVTVDTWCRRIDSEFERLVEQQYCVTNLHWTLEPIHIGSKRIVQ